VEKNFFPKSRCSAGIDRWSACPALSGMAAGFAEIALALAKLPIFCGRFQTATHRNLYQSVIQWRHCCLIYEKAGSATARPSPRKEATCPAGLGWVAPGAAG